MKYIKIIFLLLLIWPKFWYMKVANKAEEKWRKEGEIPPQYSDETKKLIKKQKRTILEAMRTRRELRRQRQRTLIKYLEEKFKLEDDINWENTVLPGSEEELKLKEFLFGEQGILTQKPEKDKYEKREEKTEELTI